MQPSVDTLRPHLYEFDFQNLMVEGLGWDHHYGGQQSVLVDGAEYTRTLCCPP